jgi:hypothetical protein
VGVDAENAGGEDKVGGAVELQGAEKTDMKPWRPRTNLTPGQVEEWSPGGWTVLLRLTETEGVRRLSWLAESSLGGHLTADTGEELLGLLWALERETGPEA